MWLVGWPIFIAGCYCLQVLSDNKPVAKKQKYLIEQLIVVTSRLDALVAHKNVLQPMGI